jgi:hypothetical protein
MGKFTRLLLAGAVCCAVLPPGAALADPGEDHGHDEIPTPLPTLPNAGPGIQNMRFLDAVDEDGTTNSDLAFFGNTAYAGTYDGFKIINIRRPTRLRTLSETRCRANQGDLSVFEADGRRILLQSIDRPVTAPDCSGVDTGTIREPAENVAGGMATRARFGFEGLRMFDVTNPRSPEYIGFDRTPCGSHTHTLVPDRRNGVMHAYVSSYPLGGQITPQADRMQSDALGLTCEAPFRKISVVDIPLGDVESGQVRQVSLSEDTEPYDPDGDEREEGGEMVGGAPPFQACHDLQAFLPRNIMVASCAGDLQYWDISDRGDPSSSDDEAHTHIQREDGTTESFDFMHNATVTWDGEVVTAIDESGGGGEPRCDGPNTKRGFTFFYPLVEPGEPVDGFDDLLGRYMIPRPQNNEICVSHNGNVLPIEGRYLQTQAFYQGGNSFYEFTDLTNPVEIGFSDRETRVGKSDSWSTYFYNGVMYVNGGLNRAGQNGNRGFEAYRLYDEDGEVVRGDKQYRHMNPQTQERFQAPGESDADEDEDDEDDEDGGDL